MAGQKTPSQNVPWGAVFVHFLFFFGVIFSYYIAKPIRNSLFLEWMGPETLPYVHLLSAVVTLAGAAFFEFLLKHFWPRHLLPAWLAGFALFLAGFWLIFRHWNKLGAGLSFVLYLFISFMAVAVVTAFWAACNDFFPERVGRKVYGWIGLGGILGGMAGGRLTQWLAPVLGTENLLLLSAGILLATGPIPYFTLSRVHGDSSRSYFKGIRRPNPFRGKTGIALIFKHKYVFLIAAIVFCGTLSATFFDFQYQSIIVEAGLPKDERTALFGKIFFSINMVAVGVHVLLTGPILARLGPAAGLLPLPLLAVGGTLWLGLAPELLTVILFWSISAGLGYSLNQVAKETLYLPAPRDIKYQAKFYIDTFVFRFGDAAASMGLLFLIHVVRAGPRSTLWGNALAACLWLAALAALYLLFLSKPNPRTKI